VLQLEMDGADRFFGEPAFKLEELLRTRPDGKGTINVLASERLVQSPRLYSTFPALADERTLGRAAGSRRSWISRSSSSSSTKRTSSSATRRRS
jgi:hypothetical protein